MCQDHTGVNVSLLTPGETRYTACHPRKTTTYILHVVSVTTQTPNRRKSIGQKIQRKEKKIRERKERRRKRNKRTKKIQRRKGKKSNDKKIKKRQDKIKKQGKKKGKKNRKMSY